MNACREFHFLMRLFSSLLLFLPLLLVGCGESRSTDTSSAVFSSLKGKQAFLERYVNFRRSYEELAFHIFYSDGGGGMAPGPSEWNVRLFAVVPEEELGEWISGLKPVETADTSWVAEIPGGPKDVNFFEWFGESGRIVGIDRSGRRVLYRNWAF